MSFSRRLKPGVIASLFFLGSAAAEAQPAKEVSEHVQFWTSLNTTTRLTNRLGAIADVHVRRNHFLSDGSFDLLRLGGHYWVSDKLQASLGYAHVWHAPACDGCETWGGENRVYQQLQYAARVGRVSVLQRVRNEQRWKETIVGDVATGATTFSDRIRYLVSLTVPVSKDPRVPSLVFADEIAVQFGREVVFNTFDQNRAFLGVKQPLGRSWSFDLGYMLVYQQKASGYRYDLNHTLRWFLYFTPDLRKRESPRTTRRAARSSPGAREGPSPRQVEQHVRRLHHLEERLQRRTRERTDDADTVGWTGFELHHGALSEHVADETTSASRRPGADDAVAEESISRG
jgi:hypothetical protein